MDKKPKSAKKGDILTAKQPRWREDVDDGSFIAAFKYLTLFMDDELAFFLTERLRDQQNVLTIRARDLLQAAGLPILDRTDVHVTHNLVNITNGIKLSPVLCLRGDRKHRSPLIANGYYRVCAAYYCDPDTEVPVKII